MNDVVINRTRLFPESVYHFAAWKINNHKEEAETYPTWLKQYLEQCLHKKIDTLELRDVQYIYTNGKFEALNNSWSVLKVNP